MTEKRAHEVRNGSGADDDGDRPVDPAMGNRRPEAAGVSTDGHVIRWPRLYDALVTAVSLGKEREMRRQTVALAELQPGHRVLDVGCGTGSLVIAAARAVRAIHVNGIDPAPEMIERARQKAAAARVEAGFEVGVIEKLGFPADTFHAVLSSLMLHHLPLQTRRAGLAEVHRVLRPGGRLVAIDLTGPGPLLHRLGRRLTGGRAPSEEPVASLRDLIHEVGFDQVVQHPMQPSFLFSIVARKPAKDERTPNPL